MRATQAPTFTPGSREWTEQRARRVGGSEIAAVMGFSPWQSPFSLWHRKNAQWDGEPDNAGMEWGRRLEPVIADKWRDEHGGHLLPGDTWTHPAMPYAIASPDRLIAPGGTTHDDVTELLEVKTDHFADQWGEPGTDQVPLHYRMQTLWCLVVCGLTVANVAVLINGSDYREYRVTLADAGTLAEVEAMKQAAEQFVATLHAGQRPPIDGHDATYQVIRALHPEIEPVDVELPADLARAYCTARAHLRDAKDDEQRTAALVLDHLGTAKRATFLGDTIATRQARGNGTPYLVAGRNLPDLTKAA